jgi:hypothetical protein
MMSPAIHIPWTRWRLTAHAALAVLLLSGAAAARAHTVSTAYVRLEEKAAQPKLRVDLPLRDLDELVGIDTDGDGRITWRKVQSAEQRITAVVTAGVEVRRGGIECRMAPQPIAIVIHAGTPHAVVSGALGCPSSGPWSVDYHVLFDRDRTHRALLAVGDTQGATAIVLDADHHEWRSARPGFALFRDFVRQGIWHIWLGYDHLAFLLLLLLPAVLDRGPGGWRPIATRRTIVVRVLKVVTAFTAAHSITLSLAALGVLTPPAAPVEAAIAVTVILAGLANLVPRLAVHGAGMAFAFGLIHGFGFANALAELGLQAGSLAAPLAGFNIGVELGQLAVVAVVLPVLASLRLTRHYSGRLMPAASSLTILVAIGWLFQRIGA